MNLKSSWSELKSYRCVLSGRCIGNLFLVVAGYYLSRLTRRAIVLAQPYAISIEPTTACNLSCPQCPTGAGILQRPKGSLSDETFKTLVNKLPSSTFIVNLYLQGEPLLNRQLPDFIKYLSDRQLYSIVSTNGQLLDDGMAEKLVRSGLSKIIVSLDGATEESYQRYRVGGSFQKVLNALKALNRARTQAQSIYPFVELQCIVFEHNEHEVQAIYDLARLYHIDKVSLKSAQIIDTSNDVKPASQNNLSRYTVVDGLLSIKGHNYRHCFKVWGSMVFTWNGTAMPCCYDKEAVFELGNINYLSFNYIWRGFDFTKFRNALHNRPQPFDICRNCPENKSWFW
jgi:MoaA/NifB/PqqE/SkfB family radical SAM enzyme